MSSQTTVAVAALLAAMGCRTSGAVAVPGGVVGGIGDDVCAIRLTHELTAVDPDGGPLSGVDLWRVDRHHVTGKALRLGTTDSAGRLTAPDCYMASLEFRFWKPDADPVRLDLMLLREGFGVEHLRLTPSTPDVLIDGNTLGVAPGRSFEWSEISPRRSSFRVVTRVTLKPTAGP